MRGVAAIAVFGVLLSAAAVLRLLVGGEGLGWPGSPTLWELRLERLAAGAAVGSSLAVAGVLLQSLLRNPLASPDLMGLAAGSGFCVMLAQAAGLGSVVTLAGFGAAAGPALFGALGALGLVYLLSQRRGLIDPVSMVLVGVIVGLVFGAATELVRFTLPDRGENAARWLLGGLNGEVRWESAAIVGGLAVAAMILSCLQARSMDAASLSEDEARSAGVPLARLRAFQFVASGVLTAAAVTIAGPIGFIGLVAPHVARLVNGPGHGTLVVAAGLAGAALVVGADAGVMSVRLPSGRPPIGVLTSMLGGPVFLALLWRERRG
ncbi:MAG: iron ABC transporter permease [Planctomycetota bacterium]